MQVFLGQEYFGNAGRSSRDNDTDTRPMMIRNHTAPITADHPVGLDIATSPVGEGGGPDPMRKHFQRQSKDSMSKSRYGESSRDGGKRSSKESSKSSRRSSRKHSRGSESKDKRSMLSKALQKAHTAVLLDNAGNFEGALDAYEDACRLLQAVMDRTTGDEERRKLDAIKVTYTNRVEELSQMQSSEPAAAEGKDLPARPMSDDSIASQEIQLGRTSVEKRKEPATLNFSAPSRMSTIPALDYTGEERESYFSKTMQAVDASARQEPRDPPAPARPAPPATENERPSPLLLQREPSLRRAEAPHRLVIPYGSDRKPELTALPSLAGVHLSRPNHDIVPAPLLPRRPLSPRMEDHENASLAQLTMGSAPASRDASHERQASSASTSWLDTIDESASSDGSSVHSVNSQHKVRRKRLRGVSRDMNPDFDAAFDAAVEAAYNEGLEPDLEGTTLQNPGDRPPSSITHKGPVFPSNLDALHRPPNDDDEEAEAEERLLDDFASDFVRSFNFDMSSKSAVPRQSDSSGYSRSTRQSSQLSDRATAATSLTTVAEDLPPPPIAPAVISSGGAASSSFGSEYAPPLGPPPQGILPQLPGGKSARAPATGFHGRAPAMASSASLTTSREEAATPVLGDGESDLPPELMLRSLPSLDKLSVMSEATRPTTANTVTTDRRSVDEDDAVGLRSHRPAPGKKNKSSLSLRDHSFFSSPDSTPMTPGPMSAGLPTLLTRSMAEAHPMPPRANFSSFGGTSHDSQLGGGGSLFDVSLTAPSSSEAAPATPHALEPCPEPFLLRPFWLMRALLQTLTHPKGGFVTTRLFVPREAWHTRGVKLRSVEDKIASCDVLTAALARLAAIDLNDIEATADELQGLEEVMERAQAALAKKLGGDVGVGAGNMAGLFKDAPWSSAAASGPTSGAGSRGSAATSLSDATPGAEKTRSKEGKGYLNPWRKLRNKSSATPLSGGGGGGIGGTTTAAATTAASTAARHQGDQVLHLASVPMTSFVPVELRGQHRREAATRPAPPEGPHREYMAALARLLEATQVLGESSPFSPALSPLPFFLSPPFSPSPIGSTEDSADASQTASRAPSKTRASRAARPRTWDWSSAFGTRPSSLPLTCVGLR